MSKKNLSRSILIIDDNAKERESIKEELSGITDKYNFLTVANGIEALELLLSEKTALPSIILLDVNMPKMNGFEFLRIIKSYHRFIQLKIYLMNSSAEEYDKIQGKKFGARGYLIKPFNLQSGTPQSNDIKKLKRDLKYS